MDRADDPLTRRANLDFIRASMRAPLLSREHEFALARRWREERDVAALHEFVRAYTRFVIAIAARFRNYGLAMGDLVQEGNVGLMQAALRFEPERDIRFSTYAAWWIRSAMQDYILRNWSIVRTGTTAAQKALFFNLRRLRARIADLSGGVMSREARQKIADELQVSLADVEIMEMRLGGADQSLNTPLRADGEDDRQDLIADARANPEEVLIGQRDSAARSRWLAQALRELTPREQRIIRRRRLSEKGTTLEALGRELGVSKERVRQLEHRALSKLKTAIERRVEVKADLLPG
ncbi:MAG: RNA polymerase factor sigma-32 [Stellaceae bacterium]